MSTPSPEFIDSVRTALTHLYDSAYLQTHPLAFHTSSDHPLDQVTRAQQLRRTLLGCIEALRPQSGSRSDDARAYAVLAYRFIDGLTMEEIEARLALSRRQTYREYSKGIDAVASQLWDMGVRSAEESDSGERNRTVQNADGAGSVLAWRDLVAEEVDRLSRDTRRESLPLAEVVQAVCQLLATRAQQVGITIHTAIDPALQIVTDRTILRQVLLNLLSQALDMLPKQGVLALTARVDQANLVLQIAEDAPETGQDRTPPPSPPQGIGLAIAQALIQAQGGTLTLGDADPWQANLVLPVTELPAGAPTVLLVDDNEDLLVLFRRYLAGHRINVISANGSSEVHELAGKVQPHLIVLDVMMPHVDGWEILQILRSDPQTAAIPVVICSVLNERTLALSLGARDTLSKPVSQSQLLDVLQRWLGKLPPVG